MGDGTGFLVSGLLEGVAQGLVRKREESIAKQQRDFALQRETLGAIWNDPNTSPQARAFALQGLLLPSPSLPKGPISRHLGKGKGQPDPSETLRQVLAKIQNMPVQTQPERTETKMGVQPQPRQPVQGTELPPMPTAGARGPAELPLETPGAKPTFQTTTIPEVPGLFKPTQQAGTLAERRESRLEQAQTFREKGSMTDAQLADRGLMRDESGNTVPAPPEKWSPAFTAKMDAEGALVQLRESQEAMDNARTELEKAKADPKSEVYKTAQAKLRAETDRNNIARRRLGISERRQELSEEQQRFRETGPTTTTRTKAQQADVVLDQGQQLLDWIDQHPEAFGVQIATLSEAVRSTDPEVAEAATRLKTFAALQPALHGSRGIGMQKEFEDAVGKLWSQPEVLKARVRALMNTATSFRAAGTYQKGSKGTTKRKVGDVVTSQGKRYRITKLLPENKYEAEPVE